MLEVAIVELVEIFNKREIQLTFRMTKSMILMLRCTLDFLITRGDYLVTSKEGLGFASGLLSDVGVT